MSLGLFLIAVLGIAAGIAAGLLGIGGGIVIVPALLALGYAPLQAIGTSSLMIVLTAFAGSWQNWRAKEIRIRDVLPLALPSMFLAQLGAFTAARLPEVWVLTAFAAFTAANIYLLKLRRRLVKEGGDLVIAAPSRGHLVWIGAAAGFFAGLFGVGGGVVLVPLLVIFADKNIKEAVRLSLFVIFFTAISACTGHILQGHVNYAEGIVLGIAGGIGSKFGLLLLHRVSEKHMRYVFQIFLAVISAYLLYRAYHLGNGG